MHINLNLIPLSIDSWAWYLSNMKLEEIRKRSFCVILMRGPDLDKFLYELSVKSIKDVGIRNIVMCSFQNFAKNDQLFFWQPGYK